MGKVFICLDVDGTLLHRRPKKGEKRPVDQINENLVAVLKDKINALQKDDPSSKVEVMLFTFPVLLHPL